MYVAYGTLFPAKCGATLFCFRFFRVISGGRQIVTRCTRCMKLPFLQHQRVVWWHASVERNGAHRQLCIGTPCCFAYTHCLATINSPTPPKMMLLHERLGNPSVKSTGLHWCSGVFLMRTAPPDQPPRESHSLIPWRSVVVHREDDGTYDSQDAVDGANEPCAVRCLVPLLWVWHVLDVPLTQKPVTWSARSEMHIRH